MSSRHTNREIKEAKMLARRLEAARGVRTTTSVSFAMKMFCLALWTLVKGSVRRTWSRMLTIMGSAVCPHCYGSGKQYQRIESEPMTDCRLCEGSRRIGQTKQEAVRYGKALAQARIEQRVAAAFAAQKFSVEVNGEQYTWHDLENGYVPVIDWPLAARRIAESYMRDSAHTH